MFARVLRATLFVVITCLSPFFHRTVHAQPVTLYSQTDNSGEILSQQPNFLETFITANIGNVALGKGKLTITFTMADPNASNVPHTPTGVSLRTCSNCKDLQTYLFTDADRTLLSDGAFHTFTVQTSSTTLGTADGTSPIYIAFFGLSQFHLGTHVKSNAAGTIPYLIIEGAQPPPPDNPQIPSSASVVYTQNDNGGIMTNEQPMSLEAWIESASLGNLSLGSGRLYLKFTIKSPITNNFSLMPDRVSLETCASCLDLQSYHFTNADRALLSDEAFHTFLVETDSTSSTLADGTRPIYINFSGLYQIPHNTEVKSNVAATLPTLVIAKADPCSTDNTCASNVLFLPGIEASRLYRDGSGEAKLWEPGVNDNLHDLYLAQDGKSLNPDIYVKEGDVIDEVPVLGYNIYKSFIAKMNDLVSSHKINAWEADPYDWRLSLSDILSHGKQTGTHISYAEASSTPYIIQELKKLASTSKTGKVTIVAHSNGGLVAKQLTQILGEEASSLIDKFIFVAVPQVGTPAAVGADLHGYDQAIVKGLVVSKADARAFASTTPMAYNLLPSASYFGQVDDPVITFDASLPDWITRYGAVIHSESGLRAFLTDSFGRVNTATATNVDQPIQLSSTLLSSAEAVHSSLDNWVPPNGTELIQIAGWGIPTTMTGLTYTKKDAGVFANPHFTIDGDGTVVVPSALWTSTPSRLNFWVDLMDYNKHHPFLTAFGRIPFDHSKIFEVDPVLNFLIDEIKNVRNTSSVYSNIYSNAPASTELRLRYSLHSPLSLNLYDGLGRHTGVSTTTGQIEEQIPGTYYTEFGDVKYIFTDASDPGHVIMNGYAPGTFTFNVDQYAGDTLNASSTFKDIPTTNGTNVSINVQTDITTLSSMNIDENGDGITDANIAPLLNGVATFPVTYKFDGFLQPINDTAHQVGQSVSVFKGGSTIPVKFQIKTSAGIPVQTKTDPIWLAPVKGSTMSAAIDESVTTGTASIGTVYKWDSSAQQYVYNWNTKGLATGFWYKIYAKLDDGNTYLVTIGLK